MIPIPLITCPGPLLRLLSTTLTHLTVICTGAGWSHLTTCAKAHDAVAYPMAGFIDRGSPAVLGGLAISARADSESRVGCLRGHCGLEPDLFFFAVGRLAFRRVWPVSPTLSI